MKCPLLKTVLPFKNGYQCSLMKAEIVEDLFQDCIKTNCMAWSEDRQTCNYFNPDNKRAVEVKIE